jgi:hypothetical protein
MAKGTMSLTQTLARVTSAIVGVQKNLSTVAQISLAGVVYSPTTLVALLQAYANLVAALIAAHNQVHGYVLSERAQRKQIAVILHALAAFAENMFGTDPNKLGDFGFTPPKARVESAATRAAAAVKASATRKAKKAALAAVGQPAAVTPPAAASTTTKS